MKKIIFFEDFLSIHFWCFQYIIMQRLAICSFDYPQLTELANTADNKKNIHKIKFKKATVFVIHGLQFFSNVKSHITRETCTTNFNNNVLEKQFLKIKLSNENKILIYLFFWADEKVKLKVLLKTNEVHKQINLAAPKKTSSKTKYIESKGWTLFIVYV